MSLVSLRRVTKSFGGSLIFSDASFEVRAGDRIGVIGPNGSGKTTLTRIILGLEPADSGEVSRSRSVTFGHLPQHNVFDSDRTVLEETLSAFADLFAIERELRVLEAKMGEEEDADELDRLLRRHTVLHEEFERADGWTVKHRAEAVLLGLGIPQEFFGRDASTLSGGEAGRVALARLLLRTPDVLLLDEPTNHLDLAGCEWLEDYLGRSGAAFLLISHDRYFLDRVTNRTIEVLDGGVSGYDLPFSRYLEKKAEEEKAHARAFRDQQDFIKKERTFIKKHMGTQRTREAKGRLKRLERFERLERLDRPAGAAAEMRISLTPKRRLGTDVLEAEELAVAFGERRLFEDLSLRIGAGDRVGIAGANGTGKSTLLKILAGRAPAPSGRLRTGSTVELGYYDQLHECVDRASTPFDEIAGVDLACTELQVRSYLARFFFYDDDLRRPVTSLSGGERGRLALAKILLQRPNVLLLDEPTNHLDIPARQSLEECLDEFDGTIVVVSHDRYFLDRICTRILYFDGNSVRSYYGNYSESRAKRETAAREESERVAVAAEKAKVATRAKPQPKPDPAKKKLRPLSKIEGEIIELEERKADLLAAMGREDVYRDPRRLADHKDELASVEEALAGLEAEWEQHA